jgi:hypothetical protein
VFALYQAAGFELAILARKGISSHIQWRNGAAQSDGWNFRSITKNSLHLCLGRGAAPEQSVTQLHPENITGKMCGVRFGKWRNPSASSGRALVTAGTGIIQKIRSVALAQQLPGSRVGMLARQAILCNIDATKKAAPKLIQKPLHSINNKLFSIKRG